MAANLHFAPSHHPPSHRYRRRLRRRRRSLLSNHVRGGRCAGRDAHSCRGLDTDALACFRAVFFASTPRPVTLRNSRWKTDVAGWQRGSSFVRRVVVSSAGVNRDLRRGRLLFAEAIGKETVQRHTRDLRRGIPERHIERPHRTATLAVTAGFLAGHHQTPCAKWVEVGPCVVDEVSLAGGEQTSGEALANEPSLRKTTNRSEAIADDRTSAANDISNYGYGACSQTTGWNRWVRVAEIGRVRSRTSTTRMTSPSHFYPPLTTLSGSATIVFRRQSRKAERWPRRCRRRGASGPLHRRVPGIPIRRAA